MSHDTIVLGTDYSGLGWCHLLKQQGANVAYAYELPKEVETAEDKALFECNGEGIVEKMTIEQAEKYVGHDATWICESNSTPEFADYLVEQGERVLMGQSVSATLEHDRAEAMKMAKDSGLGMADLIECKTVEEAIQYLEAHEDTAYVFKPNDSSLHYLTFVPDHQDDDQANDSLRQFLAGFKESGSKGFVLQERKKGVECNFELWLVHGKPVLATCGLESKRILNADKGEHCGCAQDLFFTVPLNCRGIRETVGKTLPYYAERDYTGCIDVNAIISDNEVWFLEVCDRFGYSAHPNMILNLCMADFADFVNDMLDGKSDPSHYEQMFRSGFGASINLYMDHPREGWPIIISDKVVDHYFPYDLYMDEDKFKLAGYSNDIGVVCQHGYTIEDAANACLDVLHRQRVWFPDMGHRTDLPGKDYPNAPAKRYEALQAMRMFS